MYLVILYSGSQKFKVFIPELTIYIFFKCMKYVLLKPFLLSVMEVWNVLLKPFLLSVMEVWNMCCSNLFFFLLWRYEMCCSNLSFFLLCRWSLVIWELLVLCAFKFNDKYLYSHIFLEDSFSNINVTQKQYLSVCCWSISTVECFT